MSPKVWPCNGPESKYCFIHKRASKSTIWYHLKRFLNLQIVFLLLFRILKVFARPHKNLTLIKVVAIFKMYKSCFMNFFEKVFEVGEIFIFLSPWKQNVNFHQDPVKFLRSLKNTKRWQILKAFQRHLWIFCILFGYWDIKVFVRLVQPENWPLIF